jgi:hypothetical protein
LFLKLFADLADEGLELDHFLWALGLLFDLLDGGLDALVEVTYVFVHFLVGPFNDPLSLDINSLNKGVL